MAEHVEHEKTVLSSENLRIIVSDVLDASLTQFGTFDAIYDRAAAVALPHETRLRYARAMRALLKPNGAIFLITFVDPNRTTGPPFAIDEHGVRKMYPDANITCIDVLDPKENAALPPNAMMQKAFWITW